MSDGPKIVRRAFLYGFFVWLIPFIAGFLLFPLRKTIPVLFESAMCVVLAATVVVFSVRYFRSVTTDPVQAGIRVGLLWLAISLALDLPLFLQGPMKMPLADYLADIGLTYVVIPTITIGFGFLAERSLKKQ